jgi:hypothetical protein
MGLEGESERVGAAKRQVDGRQDRKPAGADIVQRHRLIDRKGVAHDGLLHRPSHHPPPLDQSARQFVETVGSHAVEGAK